MLCLKFKLVILFHSITLLPGHVLLEDHDEIPTIARYFGPKGRYEEVNPYLLKNTLGVNISTLQISSPRCQQMHMTAIIRHGTRYPTAKNIKKMHWLYNFVVNNTSSENSQFREHWRVCYMEDMDGRLVQKGVDELKHLAVRLSKMFPTLISEEKLRGGSFRFITSSTHRCVNSTVAFKRGLTELWDIKGMDIEHEENNALMRFFNHCARFVRDVDTNPSAIVEVDRFQKGPDMSRVLEKMADRLNVTHTNVTYDMAEAAFFLCAYDFAINNTVSPWCQLFDEEDAKVMEYASDLKEYWKRGYGHDINFKSSCILFHDVFKRLEKAAVQVLSGEDVTNAVTIQIGHADTLLPLLTLLGFFKDSEPLTSANYAAQTKRTFRTSHMLPYSANLILVLYECGGGELRVQLLLNEKVVMFPALHKNQSLMPLYRDVKEGYKELLQGCDFEAECRLENQ